MKVRFIVFSDDISEKQNLYEINNAEIKFGAKKVITRTTIDVNVYDFLSFVFDGLVCWKYRMYDMNNRKRNVWLIREKDFKRINERRKNDN